MPLTVTTCMFLVEHASSFGLGGIDTNAHVAAKEDEGRMVLML